jgi:hypothetical protein
MADVAVQDGSKAKLPLWLLYLLVVVEWSRIKQTEEMCLESLWKRVCKGQMEISVAD